MLAEPAATLARVKALALGAMIQAGGKPAWVAAYAPDGSAAARVAAATANKTRQVDPAARPVVSRPAAAPANKTEESLLASMPPAVRFSVERALRSADLGPRVALPWAAAVPAASLSQATRSGGVRG
jgi:hypothetical protein